MKKAIGLLLLLILFFPAQGRSENIVLSYDLPFEKLDYLINSNLDKDEPILTFNVEDLYKKTDKYNKRKGNYVIQIYDKFDRHTLTGTRYDLRFFIIEPKGRSETIELEILSNKPIINTLSMKNTSRGEYFSRTNFVDHKGNLHSFHGEKGYDNNSKYYWFANPNLKSSSKIIFVSKQYTGTDFFIDYDDYYEYEKKPDSSWYKMLEEDNFFKKFSELILHEEGHGDVFLKLPNEDFSGSCLDIKDEDKKWRLSEMTCNNVLKKMNEYKGSVDEKIFYDNVFLKFADEINKKVEDSLLVDQDQAIKNKKILNYLKEKLKNKKSQSTTQLLVTSPNDNLIGSNSLTNIMEVTKVTNQKDKDDINISYHLDFYQVGGGEAFKQRLILFPKTDEYHLISQISLWDLGVIYFIGRNNLSENFKFRSSIPEILQDKVKQHKNYYQAYISNDVMSYELDMDVESYGLWKIIEKGEHFDNYFFLIKAYERYPSSDDKKAEYKEKKQRCIDSKDYLSEACIISNNVILTFNVRSDQYLFDLNKGKGLCFNNNSDEALSAYNFKNCVKILEDIADYDRLFSGIKKQVKLNSNNLITNVIDK